MLRHDQVGLGGLLPLLLCLAAPILVLFVRARWRRAADRQEEIRRLLLRASEEARIAEFEYGGGSVYNSSYGQDYAPYASTLPFPNFNDNDNSIDAETATKPKLCAVCYSPTTTRCARCKAVRYCSGKCQIVHWRQGHKDECRPPDDVQNDAAGSGSNSADTRAGSKTSQRMDTSLEQEPRGLHIERHTSFEPASSSSIFTEETDSEVRSSASTVDTNTLSDASAVSSPAHSGHNLNAESSNPASIDANYDHVAPAESQYSSSHEISYMSNRSTVNISKAVHRKLPSNLTNETYVNTSLNKFTEEVEIQPPALNSESSLSTKFGNYHNSSNDVTSTHNSGQKDHYKNKSAQEDNLNSIACQKGSVPTDYGRVHSSKNTDIIEQKPSLATESESNTDPARSRSNYKSVPDNSASSKLHSTGNVPVSGGKNSSSVIRGSQPGKLLPAAVLSSSGYGIKTSVRKVVDQLRPSKPTTRLYKTLFPYDIFTKLYNEKVELRPCGLTNVGNSCYANVVLQCLAFTRPLTSYFLQGLHKKMCKTKDWCFTCEMESLVSKMKQGKSPISPTGILSQIHNIGGNLGKGKEEDAHEFLRCAIDSMQSVCIKEAGENTAGKLAETTLMQLIFGGYLRSKIKCMRCHGKSERYERMLDLTVEIQGDIWTIEEALTRFTKCELLDGENKYRCDRCKSYERAKKEMKVAEAPNVLTIALKRFQSGKFGKINKTVTFPEILDLAPYMVNSCDDKSPVYGLYAVVVHLDVMNAAFSGHYVCYIKNSAGKWYKIDDSSVKPVDLERVLSKEAYMLLYARCSPRAPSLAKELISVGSGKVRSRTSQEASSNGQSRGSGSAAYRTADALIGRYFHSPLHNNLYMSDSSSDNSSIFGACSDEGSCSTDSTRDSTSTDDYDPASWDSDYNRNHTTSSSSSSSPFRTFEESEGPPCSPSSYRYSSEASRPYGAGSLNPPPENSRYRRTMSYDEGGGFRRQDMETPVFLRSDTTKPCRLTGQYNSSSREAINWGKPSERTGTWD